MPNGLDAADALVVGAGLAGLVATAELADAGRRVILVDQEPEASLGGQAFWSLGGLMLVDSPEQRGWAVGGEDLAVAGGQIVSLTEHPDFPRPLPRRRTVFRTRAP